MTPRTVRILAALVWLLVVASLFASIVFSWPQREEYATEVVLAAFVAVLIAAEAACAQQSAEPDPLVVPLV